MTDINTLYSIYLSFPVICTDTRNISKDSIFFALKGANFNGNEFAEKALELGAKYVVIDEEKFKKDDRFILVDDVLTALQKLARHHRDQLNIPVIGITGTNGKTTTKELINAVLSGKYKTLATKGNLNNHIGVPLTVLSITNNIETAIIEMGANHQKEIAMLSHICDPDYGIISNVGKAHLEGFGGFEGVKKGKKELYDYLHLKDGTIFINGNDPDLMEMSAALEKKILYGIDGFFDVNGELISSDPFLTISFSIMGDEKKHIVKSNLVGDYNINNILAAITIGNYFEVPVPLIINGIEKYTPTNNRSQIVEKNSNKIIMDAYNANPSSMQAAIKNFAQLKDVNKWMILGDMFELGDESEKEHHDIIQLVRDLNLKNVLFIGKDFYKNRISDYYFFEQITDAADLLKNQQINNSTILIKGSRGMKLELLLEEL
jgi:UDP-N-acetylmuramoyl-tripeptide--D-alanyl-D-alanine ligase